jgi:uncharacterized SAM-binding protein YcdF (DUF218 family)
MTKRLRLKLLRRQEIWILTWQGWLLAIGLILLLLFSTVRHIYPWLAVQQPIAADALVIEGWVNDDSLQDAAQEFRSRPYQSIIVTGGPLPKGFYLMQHKSFAELGKATLMAIGLPVEKIVAVPSPQVKRDRTYTSAVSFRDWLDQNSGKISSINLISNGVHARRSWLLFQKALGDRVRIGIIATPDRDFEADRWWASSEGFKRVLFELVGYLYIQLFKVME